MTSFCNNTDTTTVLLKNVSEHLDTWTFRRQGSVGKLVQNFERHPKDLTVAMLWVDGCENAKKVASFFNNRKLYDSEIALKAYYACSCQDDQGVSAPEANVVAGGSSSGMQQPSGSESGRSSANSGVREPDVKLFAGASSSGMQLPGSESGRISANSNSSEGQSVNPMIKHEPALADEVSHLDARNYITAAAPTRTERMNEIAVIPPPLTQSLESDHHLQVSLRPVARATGPELPRGAGPSVGQGQPGSSRDMQVKCRYCLREGHPTRACEDLAEYYHVSSTAIQDHYGCTWTRFSTTRIKELLAGPVIQHFEKKYFNGELSHFEMRVVFGFVMNPKLCSICGIPGHQGQEGVCQFSPQTDAGHRRREEFLEMLQMIRRSVPFAELQKRVQQVDSTYRQAKQRRIERLKKQTTRVPHVGMKRPAEGSRQCEFPNTPSRHCTSYSERPRSAEAVTMPLASQEPGYFQQDRRVNYTP